MFFWFFVGSLKFQFFLLDLKRGVEVSDFKGIRNVIIAKNEACAVRELKSIRKEMNLRYEYLQNKGFKKIEP